MGVGDVACEKCVWERGFACAYGERDSSLLSAVVVLYLLLVVSWGGGVAVHVASRGCLMLNLRVSTVLLGLCWDRAGWCVFQVDPLHQLGLRCGGLRHLLGMVHLSGTALSRRWWQKCESVVSLVDCLWLLLGHRRLIFFVTSPCTPLSPLFPLH